MSEELTALTVVLTKQADDAMNRAAATTGDTVTDTVNRALQVYTFITEHIANGDGIYTTDVPGEPKKELVIV